MSSHKNKRIENIKQKSLILKCRLHIAWEKKWNGFWKEFLFTASGKRHKSIKIFESANRQGAKSGKLVLQANIVVYRILFVLRWNSSQKYENAHT